MYENPYQRKQKRAKLEPFNNDENDSQLANSWPLDAIPPQYQLNPKEEKLHQKTLRTFFFLHAIGQLCQIRKVGNDFQINDGEQSELVIEGILESCDANSTHLIINEAVILRVYGKNPYDRTARSQMIRRAEKASVNMAEVKEIRFIGVNITKEGIQKLEQNQEQEIKDEVQEKSPEKVEPERTEKPKFEKKTPEKSKKTPEKLKIEKKTPEKSKIEKKTPEKLKAEPEIPKSEKKPIKTPEPKKEENGPADAPIRALPVPFANLYDDPIDSKIEKKLTQPKKKKEIFIDEAIVSQEQNLPKKKQKTPKNRDLIRFQPEIKENMTNLDDENHIPYDQFADKKSTYDFKNYTSNLDESKITEAQRKEADRVEKELAADEQSKKNEKLEVSEDAAVTRNETKAKKNLGSGKKTKGRKFTCFNKSLQTMDKYKLENQQNQMDEQINDENEENEEMGPVENLLSKQWMFFK